MRRDRKRVADVAVDGFVTIGRSGSNRLLLDDSGVSRFHAIVYELDGGETVGSAAAIRGGRGNNAQGSYSTIIETRPGSGCVCVLLAWAPAHVVTVAHHGRAVVLDESVRRRRCD